MLIILDIDISRCCANRCHPLIECAPAGSAWPRRHLAGSAWPRRHTARSAWPAAVGRWGQAGSKLVGGGPVLAVKLALPPDKLVGGGGGGLPIGATHLSSSFQQNLPVPVATLPDLPVPADTLPANNWQ